MVNRQHGLGRGLGALLSSSPAPAAQETGVSAALELPIDSIAPNPKQPRKDFDDKALLHLAASLTQSGILQPVVVRRLGDGYQLVVGERRWRAAKLAGPHPDPRDQSGKRRTRRASSWRSWRTCCARI